MAAFQSSLNQTDNSYAQAIGFSPTYNSSPAGRFGQQYNQRIMDEYKDELYGDLGERMVDKLKYLLPEEQRKKFVEAANQPQAQQLIGNLGESFLGGTDFMSALGGSDVQMGLGTFAAANTFRQSGTETFGGGPRVVGTDEAKNIGKEIKDAIEKEFAGPGGYLTGLSGMDRGEVGQLTTGLSRRGAFVGQTEESLDADKFKKGMGKTIEATSSLLSDMKDIFGEGKGINELLNIAEAISGQVLNSMGNVQRVQQKINEAVNSARVLNVDPRTTLETNFALSKQAAERYNSTERVAASSALDTTTASLLKSQASKEASAKASSEGYYIQATSFEQEQADALRTNLVFNDPAYKLSRNVMTSLAQAGASREEIENISSREGFGTDVTATRNIIEDLQKGEYSGVNLGETNLTKKEQDRILNDKFQTAYKDNLYKATADAAEENIQSRLKRGTLGIEKTLSEDNANVITDALGQYRSKTLKGAIISPDDATDEVKNKISDIKEKTGLSDKELNTIFSSTADTSAGSRLATVSEESQQEKLRTIEAGLSENVKSENLVAREDDTGVVRSFFEGLAGYSAADSLLSKEDKKQRFKTIKNTLGEDSTGLDFSEAQDFGEKEFDFLKERGIFEELDIGISKEKFVNDRDARARALQQVTQNYKQIRTVDPESGESFKTFEKREDILSAKKQFSDAEKLRKLQDNFDSVQDSTVSKSAQEKLIKPDIGATVSNVGTIAGSLLQYDSETLIEGIKTPSKASEEVKK